MSTKEYYRVHGKIMYVAPNPRKKFKEKYDLTNYEVQLSKGDSKKFILRPLDDSLKLKEVRFTAESPD